MIAHYTTGTNTVFYTKEKSDFFKEILVFDDCYLLNISCFCDDSECLLMIYFLLAHQQVNYRFVICLHITIVIYEQLD